MRMYRELNFQNFLKQVRTSYNCSRLETLQKLDTTSRQAMAKTEIDILYSEIN